MSPTNEHPGGLTRGAEQDHRHLHDNAPAPRWQAPRLDVLGLALIAALVWLAAVALWRAVLR